MGSKMSGEIVFLNILQVDQFNKEQMVQEVK